MAENNISNDELLTKSQTWDVLEFAQTLYNQLDGVYTPEMLNQNLVNLNNNVQVPTYQKIVSALRDMPDGAEILSSFSQYMEYFDSIYNKVATYKANMLSFDLSFVCTNANDKDYESDEYKKDKARVYKFLNAFPYKSQFRNVVKNLLRTGVYYTWFRDNGVKLDTKGATKYTLQILPQTYCKMTGYWNDSLPLFDFDMTYFLQPSIDIDLFAPVFKEYWLNVYGSEEMETAKDYIPSNNFGMRTGTFALWTQTSPKDGAWAFKYDTSNFAVVPPLASLMKDTIFDDEIAKLQRDKDFASAYALLVGDMKMLGSNEPNAFAVQPKQLAYLLSLLQRGLRRNIKVGAMPAERTDFYQYEDKNPDLYSNYIKTNGSIGASASRLIYSTDKMSQAEIENAIITDYAEIAHLYAQFEQFLNYYVNQRTRTYKFKFMLEGSVYPFERQYRQDRLLELADRGLVLNESAFASAYGYPPQVFSAMLEEAKNGGLTDKLTPLISIHTTSGGEGGRPRKRSALSTPSRDYDD